MHGTRYQLVMFVAAAMALCLFIARPARAGWEPLGWEGFFTGTFSPSVSPEQPATGGVSAASGGWNAGMPGQPEGGIARQVACWARCYTTSGGIYTGSASVSGFSGAEVVAGWVWEGPNPPD